MAYVHKALFLDRDGVINVEINYLHKIEEFKFIEGIFDLCRAFSDAGYKIIVVTNQSGIARGMYSEEDFETLTTWMVSAFKKENIDIAKVYHCPHHPDFSGECECRKPRPQMLLDAKKLFNLDMANSVMVGDKERDIEAGLNAGVKQTYLFSPFHVISSKATHIVEALCEIKVLDA